MKKKVLSVVAVIVLILAVVLGIKGHKSQQSTTTKKTKVVAATVAQSNPFTYKDGDKLTGYDVKLLEAIFKDSKEFELEWQVVDFTGVLSGIDSNRFQIGANNFSSNAERKEKYLLSDPIVKNPNVIVVRKDSDIKSLKDIAGKKAVTEVGNSGATILEEFNKKNSDDQIDISYTKEDITSQLQSIEKGTYDARIVSKISAETLIKNNGFKDLKIVQLTSEETNNLDVNSYYLIEKTDQGKKIQAFINKRLKELRKSGDWKSLSEKFFGEDNLPAE
jgi:atmA